MQPARSRPSRSATPGPAPNAGQRRAPGADAPARGRGRTDRLRRQPAGARGDQRGDVHPDLEPGLHQSGATGRAVTSDDPIAGTCRPGNPGRPLGARGAVTLAAPRPARGAGPRWWPGLYDAYTSTQAVLSGVALRRQVGPLETDASSWRPRACKLRRLVARGAMAEFGGCGGRRRILGD